MHLPHAAQQCPSCYMYCLTRGPSVGGPPVPPHTGHPIVGQVPLHLTQPRAVTLPHPCSHSHSPPGDLCGGPRPRFRSLPPQQSNPKPNLPHSNLHPHVGPGGRMGPPPSHNIVGVPIDEAPPPLPPHGPPPLPPAHLISRTLNPQKHHPHSVSLGGGPQQFSPKEASNYQGPSRPQGHSHTIHHSRPSNSNPSRQEFQSKQHTTSSDQTAIYQTIEEVLEEKESRDGLQKEPMEPSKTGSLKSAPHSKRPGPETLKEGDPQPPQGSRNTNSLPHRPSASASQKPGSQHLTLQRSRHSSPTQSSPPSAEERIVSPSASCGNPRTEPQNPPNLNSQVARSNNLQQSGNSPSAKNLSDARKENTSHLDPRNLNPNPPHQINTNLYQSQPNQARSQQKHSDPSRSNSDHTLQPQTPSSGLSQPLNPGNTHPPRNSTSSNAKSQLPNQGHSHPVHPHPNHSHPSSHPNPSHLHPSHQNKGMPFPSHSHPGHSHPPPYSNTSQAHLPPYSNMSHSHPPPYSNPVHSHPPPYSNPSHSHPPHPLNSGHSHPPHPPNSSHSHPPHPPNSSHSHPPHPPNLGHSHPPHPPNSGHSHPPHPLNSGHSHPPNSSHSHPPHPLNASHSHPPNSSHSHPLHPQSLGHSHTPHPQNSSHPHLQHPPSGHSHPPHPPISGHSHPSHPNLGNPRPNAHPNSIHTHPSQHANPNPSHPPPHVNMGHAHLPPHSKPVHIHHAHPNQGFPQHIHPNTGHFYHDNSKINNDPPHPPHGHAHPVQSHTSPHQNSAYGIQQPNPHFRHPDPLTSHPLPTNGQSTKFSSIPPGVPQGKNPSCAKLPNGCPCGGSHYHPPPNMCQPCEIVHPPQPHPPGNVHLHCDVPHRNPGPLKCSESPPLHHPKEVENKRKDGYGREGPKSDYVPPPPPMPPPPMLPPVTFDQMRYACLPHQQLVPPPRLKEVVLGCPEHGHHHISSSSKVDRPYCGPGPPGRNRPLCGPINKAHSLDVPSLLNKSHHHVPVANGNHHHLVRRPQAVSQSAVMGGSRHGLSPRGVAVDDCGSRSDRWRRNGSQSAGQSYELSQDLADKRLEMLERRYGGERARRAATTIQRAYRHYAMHKKFRAITATAKAQEKRLSRRFTVEASDWGEVSNSGHACDAEERIRSEFDKLNRNLNASVYGVDSSRRPSRSLSMRDSRTCPNARGETDQSNDSSLYCHSPSGPSPPTPALNGDLQQHLQHQSSEANSYASSRELKYFPSEDSGFGSQDPVGKHRSKSAGRGNNNKKVPPEVPRRSSSIKNESGGVDSFVAYSSANHRVQCAPPSLTPPSSHSSDMGSDRSALRRSADNGSLSSVQSSGSDSSLSQSTSDRTTPLSQDHHDNPEFVTPTSPIWKRKTQMSHAELQYDDKRLSNISENSEDSCHSVSSEGISYSQYPHGHPNSRHAHLPHHQSSFNSSHEFKISEVLRKRQYRVGLNLFNKKPERGVNYLIGRSFLENSPQAVAKFLLTRKGLSKQMIGEYLGNLQNALNMSVLECFATEIDLSGMQVDVALRKFQTHFRMPGEAQKIERLMQVFAQRYCQCNRDIVAKLRDPETIFVLAFAIIMLNTDLHTASLKPEKRMKLEDFIKNLRGVDDGCDIEREMLEGMYQRIKSQEFRPGHDHVTQVMKVQQTIVGKKPVLALPHRRLVCYCRLYEIPDSNKKERVGLHQREVFLFNDLLVVTKIFSKKKNSVTYTFRQSFPLAGLSVNTKEATHYSFLLEVKQRVDNKVLATFNARNEHDRTKFCEDLRESILEMDEMENLRIEGELERQKANLRASRPNSTAENRDSGVADMELITPGEKSCSLKPEGTLKRTALSNSLLDIHEAGL